MIADDSVFGQPCVNISLEPVRGRSVRIRRVSKPHVAHQPWCMAGRRSRAQLRWARRKKCTCETTSLPSRRKARVTNATLATDRSVSRPLCLMPGYAQWTWFFPRSAPHVVEQHKSSGAQHAFCPLERAREFQVWDANSVRETVFVLESHQATSALGAAFGSRRLRISAQAGRIGGGLPRPARGQPGRGPCLRRDRVHQIHGICLEDPVSHAHQWRRAGP